MTLFFDHVASASLPVAIGLLILAAAARAASWAHVEDERVQRVAAQYVEPLATWSVIAALAHAVGLGGAGELSFGGLAVTLAIALGSVLLRPSAEQAAEPEPEPDGLWSR